MTSTRTTLVYGASGLGKTSQIDPISVYIAEKFGRPTLLITADSGGSDALEDVKSAGLVDVFDLAVEPNPMPTLRDLLQGRHKTVKLNKYGCIAWEGLTSTAGLCLRDQTAKGRKVSQEVVGLFEEGGRKFGAPPPAMYGFIQNFIIDVLSIDIRYLPDNIRQVYITAHESRGVDTEQNTIYGPAVCGKAATGQISPHVGDMFHVDTVGNETVAWFTRHTEGASKIPFIAKPRVPPSVYPVMLQRWPKGYIPLTINSDGAFTSSIVSYLQFLDAASSNRSDELKKLINQTEQK